MAGFDFTTVVDDYKKGAPIKAAKEPAFDFTPIVEGYESDNTPVGKDIIKSIPTGLVKGETGSLGFGGFLQGLGDRASKSFFGEEPFPDKVPSSGPVDRYIRAIASTLGVLQSGADNPRLQAPTPGELTQDVEQNITGPLYEPKTSYGKLAEQGTEFGSQAAFGGGAKALVPGIVSGLGSEAAGQATEGTGYELPARLAGGIAAPMAFERAFPGLSAEAEKIKRTYPQDVVGKTPDRGYPGVPATRGGSQPEAFNYKPTVEGPAGPRPFSGPTIDADWEEVWAPSNAKGAKESVGSTSDAYPSTPMRYKAPFEHWPITEHPDAPEPPRATGAPMAGKGPATRLALPGAREVPQPPAPPAPRAQQPTNAPATTTVGKQPKDVKVFGDFAVGDDTAMEKIIAGQKMTAPAGKITELVLKPEKVLKTNPTPGQGPSKITVTEQVPYAKFADGKEIALSQLKKINSPQVNREDVQKMLKQGKVVSDKGLNFKNVDAVIDAIKNVRKVTGAQNLTYDLIKKHIPKIPDSVLDQAGQKMAAAGSSKWNWSKGMISTKPPSQQSGAMQAEHFNNLIKEVRGPKLKKFAYLRHIHDARSASESNTISSGKLIADLNQMIKQNRLKIYPEGEPEAAITKMTDDLLAETVFQDGPEYVMEFMDKPKK